MVLLLLALPFVFYMSNSKAPRDHNALDRVVVFVSAPIQWLVVGTLDGAFGLWHSYFDLVGVQKDNDRLRSENTRLRGELARREEQRLENERLRLLVGLKARAPQVRMVLARVVATSPTPLFRSLRIDRGEDDGLRLGAAVITHDGLVGRVAALAAGYADVMLMVDPNSSTDVLVQRTRARARVRGLGSDSKLGVEYLARTADVEPGDVLITSGAGDVFPKGLVVGTVVAVEHGAFGLYQHAEVQPAIDFSRVEAVMVVLDGYSGDTSFEQSQPAEAPLPATTAAPLANEGAPQAEVGR